MLTKALVMHPGLPSRTVEVDLPENPSSAQLHAAVDPHLDGGKLEHVYVLADFEVEACNRARIRADYQPLDMFVDDSGAPMLLEWQDVACTKAALTRKGKGLPRNEAATAIYRRATILGRTAIKYDGDPETLPAIYGPAVLFDRRVWF